MRFLQFSIVHSSFFLHQRMRMIWMMWMRMMFFFARDFFPVCSFSVFLFSKIESSEREKMKQSKHVKKNEKQSKVTISIDKSEFLGIFLFIIFIMMFFVFFDDEKTKEIWDQCFGCFLLFIYYTHTRIRIFKFHRDWFM